MEYSGYDNNKDKMGGDRIRRIVIAVVLYYGTRYGIWCINPIYTYSCYYL
jgi:hypothetical protein